MQHSNFDERFINVRSNLHINYELTGQSRWGGNVKIVIANIFVKNIPIHIKLRLA